jgi:hypothetical protein
MNGIYLNDIPMDVFLKYFSKESLANKQFRPSLSDVERTVYTYTLSFTGQTGTYTYKALSNLIDDIKQDIVLDFSDLFEITVDDIVEESVDAGVSETIYINGARLTPYEYYIGDNHFLSQTGVDLRNNQQVVGTPIKHQVFQLQDKNNDGDYLYIDDFGLITTSTGIESNLITHNNLFRGAYSLLNERDKIIYSKVEPGILALIKDGTKETLEFYESLTKTTSYEDVSATPPAEYENGIYDIKQPLIENFNLKTLVLNISELKRYKMVETGLVDNSLKLLYDNDTYPRSGETVVIDKFDKLLRIGNKTYEISDGKVNYYNNTSRLVSIYTNVFKQQFLEIPVINNMVEVYNDYTRGYEKISIKRSLTQSQTVVSREINGVVYRVFDASETYPEGYIRLSTISSERYTETLIAVVSFNAEGYVLFQPFSPTLEKVSLELNYGPEGYVEGVSENEYIRERYIRDINDKSKYMKITEKITSPTILTQPNIIYTNINQFKNSFISISAVVNDLDNSERGEIVESGVIDRLKLSTAKKMVSEF